MTIAGKHLGREWGELYALAARTATPAAIVHTADGARGVIINIHVTTSADTPSVVATLSGKDPTTGEFRDILSSAAITGDSSNWLRCYPGITAAANAAVSDILPDEWKLTIVHGDADSITYQVGYVLVP
jgi:hypothetical protein